jgi:hypothetical protein
MARSGADRVGATPAKSSDNRSTKAAAKKVPAASGLAQTARAAKRAPVKSATAKRARPQQRALPGDDPLAPERTRWLADAVGGSGALADMLGVSRSQTTRWASGEERPGAESAPLLIDLEHVLARVRLVWAEPAATTWMISANAHLSGARPVDVLRLQGPGPVLEALDAGAWGGAA